MSVTDGFKMGYFVWSLKPISNPNFYLLNGQNLVRNGNRIKFIDYIKSIKSKLKDDSLESGLSKFFCTEQVYNTYLKTYETCGKFVWYDLNSMLKLPTTTSMVQKDIKTYNPSELETILSKYNICYCYKGLTSWDLEIYKYNTRPMTKFRSDIDVWFHRVYGYMYLLVNDLKIDYYLDDEIPKAIILKTDI